MAFEVKSIDESTALEHYGVMGMKWGVRKDGKPQGFQSGGKDPSKRKVRKSIKKAYKAARKSGRRNSTGENMAEVDAKIAKKLANDKEYQELSSKSDAEYSKYVKKQNEATSAEMDYNRAKKKAEENRIIYDQVAESGSASQNDNAKRDYKRARKAEEQTESEYREKKSEADEAYSKYSDTDLKRIGRKMTVSESFKEEHLNAAAKDIGFEDVAQGRRLLKEYGLEEYALNPNAWSRFQNRTGVRLI